MAQIKDIAVRLLATFVATALATLGVSSMLEQTITSAPALPLWYSACLAGAAAVALVVQKLAVALKDGKLTQDEINAATDVRVDAVETKVADVATKVEAVETAVDDIEAGNS